MNSASGSVFATSRTAEPFRSSKAVWRRFSPLCSQSTRLVAFGQNRFKDCRVYNSTTSHGTGSKGWRPCYELIAHVTCASGGDMWFGHEGCADEASMAPQVQLWVLSLLLTKKAKPHLFVKHVACILVEFLLLLLKVENVEIISSVSHEALGSEGSATAHRARLDRQRATCCRSRAAVVAAVVTSCDAKLPRWAAGKTIPRCNSQNFKLNELKTLTHFFAKLWLKLCKWVNVVENQFGWVLPFWVVGQRATTEGWLKSLKQINIQIYIYFYLYLYVFMFICIYM